MKTSLLVAVGALIWLCGLYAFAFFSGWRVARKTYPSRRDLCGEEFLFVSVYFGSSAPAGLACNVTLGRSSIHVAPFIPLPFFGSIQLPLEGSSVSQSRLETVVRAPKGLITLRLKGYRGEKIGSLIEQRLRAKPIDTRNSNRTDVTRVV